MVKRALLIAVVLLHGCATPVVCNTQRADIPVVIDTPEPPQFEKRRLPIADLTDTSHDGAVLRAYAATVQMLKDMVAERDAALDAYRKGSK